MAKVYFDKPISQQEWEKMNGGQTQKKAVYFDKPISQDEWNKSQGLAVAAPKKDITRQQYYRDSYDDNVPQWLRSTDQGLIALNNWASKRPFQSDVASKIKNPVGSFAMSIPESIWNLPGRGLEQLRGYGAEITPEYLMKRGADAAQLGLEISALRYSGKAAGALGSAGMKGLKPLLGAMKQGAISQIVPGMGYGGGFGFTNAVQEDKPLVSSTLIGMGLGGITGMAGGALTPALGAGLRKVLPKAASKIAPLTDEEAMRILKGENTAEYIHPKTGKLTKRGTAPEIEQFKNPKTGEYDIDAIIKETGSMATAETEQNPTWMQKQAAKYLTSGSTLLEKMGPAGKVIRKLLEEKEFRVSQMRGVWGNTLRTLVKPLSQESKDRIWRALEKPMWKGALNEKERVAFDALDKIRKTVYEWGQSGKLNMVDEQGNNIGWSSIKPDEYVPQYYSQKVLSSQDFKERYIQQLMDKGIAKDRYEAEMKFSHWKDENPIALSHSLEHQRKLDLPGYMKDPYSVFSLYAKDVSRRIPEVDLFGKNREKLNPLLNMIAEQGHDSSMARRIIDDMYGVNQPKNALVRALTTFNTITKISLGFFINTTQQINTLQSAGFRSWAKVYKDWLLHPSKREYMHDIAVAADAYEEMIMVAENDLKANWLTDKALWIFKKSEELNRWNAANAGVNRAKQLVRDLPEAKQFEQAKIKRTLGRLGLDIEKIMKAEDPTLMDEDLIRAGFNMVNNTQFKINSMTLPPAWRTDWGRLLSQFKSFSFMQTKFIREEILKEAGKGNVRPLLYYLITAPIAYYAATTIKEFFTKQIGAYVRQGITGEQAPTLGEFAKSTLPWSTELGPDATPEEIEAEAQRNTINFLAKATGTLPGDVYQNASYMDKVNSNEYKTDLDKALVAIGNVGGPSVSLGTNLIQSAVQSAQIERENKLERPENQISPYQYPYGKTALGFIPYIGPTLKNAAFPKFPERARATFKNDLKAAVKANDQEAIQKLLSGANYTPHNLDIYKEVMRDVLMENMPKKDREAYEALKARKTELNYLPLQ